MAEGIYPAGKGKWRIFYDAPRGPGGGRRQKSKIVTGTLKQAEAERRRILSEIDQGTYTEPTKLTVGEYLAIWLRDCARPKVRPSVYQRYEGIVRLHLVPALGSIPLQALRPLHIQKAYSDWQQDGRKDGKPGGLSAQTVLHHHRLLHKALEQAVKWEMLPRNPVDGVEPPRPERKEMRVIPDEEIVRLLRSTKGHPHGIEFMIAVTTGLRRGEICGLRWCDVDLDAGKLVVSRAVGETKAGLHLNEPKTAKGRRVVDLPAFVVRELRRHKGEQAQRRLQLGSAYRVEEPWGHLVIAQWDGRPVTPNSLTRSFADLRKKLGLPVTLHGLRHSHASHLMREGVHIKVVSERLGHSRVGFTLDCYSHLLPSQQEEAARRVDAALREAMGE